MPVGHRPLTEAYLAKSRRTRSADDTAVDLPQQILESVPKCARSCISSYIGQDYSCPEPQLSCLCSNYSSDGFTLGELAYICLQLSCPDATNKEAIAAYNVCTAQPEAVRATHSTLTLPVTTYSATTSSVNTHVPPVRTTASTPTPSASTADTRTTSEPQITSVPSTTAHSPTSTASLLPSATSSGSTALTSAQAVGVSIAAMGAVIMAILGIWLFACIKRRKAGKPKDERHSYDFVDEAPPRFSPFNYGHADPRGPLGGFAMPRVELSSEKRNTEWPGRYAQYGRTQYHEKFSDRSPYVGTSVSPESHRSDCSMRTTSQLLPDKPTTVTVPPRPVPQYSGPLSTPATIFEEDRSPRFPGVLLPGRPSHLPPGRALPEPQYIDEYTHSPEQIRQPSLSLDIPRHASRSNTIEEVVAFPLPQPSVNKQSEAGERLSDRSDARTNSTSLLNYYASHDSDSTDLYSSTPIEEDMQIRRPPPAAIQISKPVYPPRAVRVSAASDHSNRTSFESNITDEPTPPDEEERRLTPVAESPIAAIRYPKIPRSSNQAVPRSPVYRAAAKPPNRQEMGRPRARTQRREQQQFVASPVTPEEKKRHGHTPTLSGSTLAAKRRGDSAANNLERGLHIANSTHSRTNSQTSPRAEFDDGVPCRPVQRHESPLKGYGRVTSSSIGRREPDWPLTLDMMKREKGSPAALQSPPWEPKLTPRREGESLYLDLSVVTPQKAHFQQRKRA